MCLPRWGEEETIYRTRTSKLIRSHELTALLPSVHYVLRSLIADKTVFSTSQLVQAIREHDPNSEMPLIQVADLGPHRLKHWREIAHFAQCGQMNDFGSLLSFTVWMLFFVDYAHDGRLMDRVAENATCQPIGLEDFEAYVGGIAGRLKSAPPDFLVTPQFYSVAIKVYDGWIEVPKSGYNFRSTLVWQSGDRMMALHTRHSV